ncbi:PEP-CTERM sorting domain-containing protein [Caldimonas brevitalea]|uniref:Ice-binding protein C-terminal domain-containing protein n=1 Tax=Caldimonas brevitalea TaxID=413882 RepID=A0A0G3BR71_9BURK|nr:PEP-CTERM sorting domain-containing protein [Caldimonas brevitalea]AKJ31922.1 hypothetical protein AAW51_5231 [Caldimonas brevitalea]
MRPLCASLAVLCLSLSDAAFAQHDATSRVYLSQPQIMITDLDPTDLYGPDNVFLGSTNYAGQVYVLQYDGSRWIWPVEGEGWDPTRDDWLPRGGAYGNHSARISGPFAKDPWSGGGLMQGTSSESNYIYSGDLTIGPNTVNPDYANGWIPPNMRVTFTADVNVAVAADPCASESVCPYASAWANLRLEDLDGTTWDKTATLNAAVQAGDSFSDAKQLSLVLDNRSLEGVRVNFSWNYGIYGYVSPVPEPSAYALFSLGALALGMRSLFGQRRRAT